MRQLCEREIKVRAQLVRLQRSSFDHARAFIAASNHNQHHMLNNSLELFFMRQRRALRLVH
jgi:hypothetical protein